MKFKLIIRGARQSDVPDLLRIDEEIWPGFRASEEMFRSRINTFPEGQFVAILNGEVVGSTFTQRINYVEWGHNFSWNDITDNGTIKQTHRPGGESLYGVGLAVKKAFQNHNIGQSLIVAGLQLAIRLNLTQILLGSRIPDYYKHKHMTIDEYVHGRGDDGKLIDQELALYQKYGGKVIKTLPDYMPDPESLNFGVLVAWKNPFYNWSPLLRKIVVLILPHVSKYL